MSGQANGASSDRAVWEAWRSEISAIGATNPLLNFELDSYAQIDLDRGHPGGMAQFVSSGTGVLSNLVRDPLAYSRALNAAKRIAEKTRVLESRFGVQSCFLAGGLADFRADGFDLQMPILLWPMKLTSRADDFELAIAGPVFVNPALTEQLEICYGVKLQQAELLEAAKTDSDLLPIAVLAKLNSIAGDRAKLETKRVLTIANFTIVPTLMGRDFEEHTGGLLEQLALGEFQNQSEPPASKVVVVQDADSTQAQIVARALAGHSFAVETLPGCGYLQTVVNTLVNLTLENRRVLVVAPRRQTLNELSDRLAAAGYNGLMVKSTSTWMDVISAISRNEKSDQNFVPEPNRAELDATESRLNRYFQKLDERDSELGISVAQAIRKLAELAAMPHPPTTKSRVKASMLLQNVDRTPALNLLTEAWELGEFKYGPQDSAWYQARFASPADVATALETAKRLHEDTFPNLTARLQEFVEAVEFKPARTLSDIGAYLRLFVGIRESLDRFVPDVFERSLSDVIAAHSSRSENGHLSGGTRRRLKKLAKEFLRPGMSVSDMAYSLQAIVDQRKAWEEFSTSLKPPMVPQGINDALVTYQALLDDLEKLESHLDPQSDEPPLAKLPLDKLAVKLASLVNDTGALDNLGERAMVANQLRELGLEEVMRDLAKLHVSKEHLALELDLAWWQSALEIAIKRAPELLALPEKELQQLEQRFREQELEYQDRKRLWSVGQLSARWHAAISQNPAEASQLKALLKAGQASVVDIHRTAPSVFPAIVAAVGASPFELFATIPKEMRFDTVIILDAAGTTVAENYSALKRSDQVLAFGDPAIAVPTGFEIEPQETPLSQDVTAESVFESVRKVFGSEVLRTNYRPSGQILGDYINREFYQNRIVFEPTTDDYFGVSRVHFEPVATGNRATGRLAGATESLDAELEKALEVIYNHALWHPNDSLLLVTPSAIHAERVRSAVTKGLKQRTHLLEFFEGHGREKFEVTTLSGLAHRIADHIVFSVGFGLGANGKFEGRLGELDSPDGRRGLANVLVSARLQITVVSCLGENDLDTDDKSQGADELLALIRAAHSAGIQPQESDSDPMLEDLALRLRKLGVTVMTDPSLRIGMVASYAKTAMVIAPDWSLIGANLTEKLRLVPALLQAHGWKYRRIHTLELFSNPEQTARVIAEELGIKVFDKKVPLFDLDERAASDSDEVWGDRHESNDSRLKNEKPPHWS